MSELNFWDFIESKMGCRVPVYLQNLLKLRGYENVFSVKTITKEDIDELIVYARGEEIKSRIKDADRSKYYGDWLEPKTFYVLPGHVKLLLEVVKFIQVTIDTKGIEYFCVKPVKPKPHQVGKLDVPSKANAPITTNTSTTSIAAPIERVCTGDSNLTETQSGSVHGDKGLEQLDTDDNISVQSSDSPDETGTEQIVKEQDHLFQGARSWMQKQVRRFYEQFSHGVVLSMVEIKQSNQNVAGMEGPTKRPDVTLLATIRCPSCEEIISAPVVKDKTEKRFSLSNFQRHVRRQHTKRKKSSRTNTRDTRSKRNAKELKSELATNRQDIACDSSESDTGDEALEKIFTFHPYRTCPVTR